MAITRLIALSLSTREDEQAAAAAAAAEPFQRSALEYNLLFRIDEWQENVLPFNNFDALKATKWTWAFSGSERGLGGEIFRMNTGYFSKLFTMLSLDIQPRRRSPFFLSLKVNQSEWEDRASSRYHYVWVAAGG